MGRGRRPQRFESLKPYDPAAVTDDLLELEDENFTNQKKRTGRRELWCYAISAKRYVLYNRGAKGKPKLRGWTQLDAWTNVGETDEPPEQLLKPSEHGLGHLLNPDDPESESRDWIAQAWELLLRADPWLPQDGPEWLDRPAVARSAVSSHYLLRLFRNLSKGKPYSDRIKPFNFMVAAFVPRAERPKDDQRMVLVAPFELSSTRWMEMPWRNRYSDREYRLTSEPFDGYVRPGVVRANTYRDVLANYLANQEAKSLGPNGKPCQADTQGLLTRRPVRVRTITHIGKESNRLEDVQAGLVQDGGEVINEYDDFYRRVFQPLVLPVLRELGVRETARRTGHSVGAVSDALAARSRPRTKALLELASRHARRKLEAYGIVPPNDAIAAVRRYLEVTSG